MSVTHEACMLAPGGKSGTRQREFVSDHFVRGNFRASFWLLALTI